MPTPRFFQLLRRRPNRVDPPPSRTEVHPPALWGQADPVWRSLWEWVSQSDGPERRAAEQLSAARQDFCQGLDGLDGDAARDLLRRASHARSMREIWHLRAELFSLVARKLSQTEAERRVGQVNRHFSVRTTVSAARPQRKDEHHGTPV